MRKVIAIEFISLDGGIQIPGVPEEDTSGNFADGGWTAPYADAVSGIIKRELMSLRFDLLGGAKSLTLMNEEKDNGEHRTVHQFRG